MKMAQYTTTARTITLVISAVLKMKGGLLPKTVFFINFTWWTGDAFSKCRTVKLMLISTLKLGRKTFYIPVPSKCYFVTYHILV